jgi:amidase
MVLLALFVACVTREDQPTGKGIEISDEITIDEIQQQFTRGELTVTQLTAFYLDRINKLSFEGPQLNAVITVNPDALDIAAQLDQELQSGNSRGALFGIPILLKDNVDTGDKMPCTAGARVMKASFPSQDSPLAAQLREAGAVILGKANLSEWANFHSNHSSSGWSGLGGQVKNPYDLTRNPCGSSSGSAVAVSANLCVVAIGTETNGSIVCPANNNGIAGIKPTVGLVSRRGIIPISFSQDTGGPMARTLKDAAICLGALTAADSLDSKTMEAGRKAYDDYTQFLRADGIRGKRIGFYKKPLGDRVQVEKVMTEAIDFLRAQGATLVEVEEVLDPEGRSASFQVLLYEFKDGLNKYFQHLGSAAPVKDLEDLIARTFADSIEMKYHDHELLKLAQSKGDLNSKEYQEALAKMLRLSRAEGIDKVMDEHQLDAIIAPTGSPAWKTDFITGDNYHIGSSSPAAIAGYPNITVPMGEMYGLPLGLSFFGRAWSEPVLLEIAYGFEQGTKHRITPKYLNGQH